MRNLSKMMDIIIENPDNDNEYILNSAGLNQGMSVKEVQLENTCLKAVKKLSPETIKRIKRVL